MGYTLGTLNIHFLMVVSPNLYFKKWLFHQPFTKEWLFRVPGKANYFSFVKSFPQTWKSTNVTLFCWKGTHFNGPSSSQRTARCSKKKIKKICGAWHFWYVFIFSLGISYMFEMWCLTWLIWFSSMYIFPRDPITERQMMIAVYNHRLSKVFRFHYRPILCPFKFRILS